MPAIDVVDSTWLAAPPSAVAAVLADTANWRRWWPGLDLRLDEDRGEKGLRWFVQSVAGSSRVGLTGTAEVWLEPMFEGVVAHFFLRLDPPPGAQLNRRVHDSVIRDYRLRTKRAFWALGDRVDPGRVLRAGNPRPESPNPTTTAGSLSSHARPVNPVDHH